ncbi:MAG: hypothetical protein JW782_00245 [Candidatus Saganbacteria bacterium]|nr:hypothetical protein [Candidatus Saganbacteria bacterium]
MTTFLVDQEGLHGNSTHYGYWNQGAWGTSMQQMVTLVDDTGLTITINDDLSIGDANEEGNGDGATARTGSVSHQQRTILSQALTASELESTAVSARLQALNNALNASSNPNSVYDLAAVREALGDETLSLQQLMDLEGEGDALIAALLEAAGENPAEYQVGMDEAFTELEALTSSDADTTLAQLQGNLAFRTFAGLSDTELAALSDEREALIQDALDIAQPQIEDQYARLQAAVEAADIQAIQSNPVYRLATGSNAVPQALTEGQQATVASASDLINEAHRIADLGADDALTERGISFARLAEFDADDDGLIQYSELEAAVTAWNEAHPDQQLTISPQLFQAVDNMLRAGGNFEGHDDEAWSEAEVNFWIETIGQLSAMTGLTNDQIIAEYLMVNEAHPLTAVDLETMSTEHNRLADLLDGPGLDLSSEAGIRSALQSIGLNTTVIDALVSHLDGDYSNLTADRLADECIRLVLALRVHDEEISAIDPQGILSSGPLSQAGFHAWLSGLDASRAPAIIAELRAEVFTLGALSTYVSESGRTAYMQRAQEYITALINSGRREDAELALAIMADPAHFDAPASLQIEGIFSDPRSRLALADAYVTASQNSGLAESERQELLSRAFYLTTLIESNSAERTNTLNSIANELIGLGNYSQALFVADMMQDGDQKNNIMARILESCLSEPTEAKLQVAYDLVTVWTESPAHYTDLARVARAFVNSSSAEIRDRASAIIALLDQAPAGTEIDQRYFPPAGGANAEPLSAQAVADQLEQELRVPLEVMVVRNMVFPPGSSDPALDQAAAAVEQLQTIISETGDAEVRAHAYLVLAQIFQAQGIQMFRGVTGDPADHPGYDMFVLMAQAARAAGEAFAELDEAAAADETYYDDMVCRAYGVIGQIVVNYSSNWQRAEHNRTGDILGQISNNGEYKDAFEALSKYIPNGVSITWQTPNGQTEIDSAVQFKHTFFSREREYSASQLGSRQLPDDFHGSFVQIRDGQEPSAPTPTVVAQVTPSAHHAAHNDEQQASDDDAATPSAATSTSAAAEPAVETAGDQETPATVDAHAEGGVEVPRDDGSDGNGSDDGSDPGLPSF